MKTEEVHSEHPMRDPASAAKLLAGLRTADPLSALDELGGWLDTLKTDSGERSEILSLIHQAGDSHVRALLTQLAALPAGKPDARESGWKSLTGYLTRLAATLHASARVLLKQAAADSSRQLAAAADAARCLNVCRLLAKAYLVRYLSVPPRLWRLAYAVHEEAEKAGCPATAIRLHASQKTTTSATQELLQLLMLQSSAPEMLAPEQIEVADRVIEQLGADFTLRARGVADNPFCFDPSSDRPPRRAAGHAPQPDSAERYFGAGLGLDALERLYKQLATTRTAEIRALGALGRDIAPHAQVSALRHLLAFWGPTPPYRSPERSPASGELQVVHSYAQLWQHLSHAGSGIRELSLADDADISPAAPETWTLQETGGNELGADLAQAANGWARCGNVLGVAMSGSGECWVGMIRAMHAESDGRVHANIAVLSRDPQTLQLRALIARGEENAYSEQAARQFAFNGVRAIILSDGSAGSQKPNLLLPPESWKEGRVYEAIVDGAARYLRGLKALRRGDDYVRATFEWVEQPA